MMEFFRFQNVKVYYMGSRDDQGYDKIDNEQPICRNYKDTHKGSVAIGYKNIEYHGIEKSVIGIVIRGTAEDDDWDSDFDMGDKELRNALNYSGGIENYEDNYDDILSELEQGILDYEKQYAQELLHFAGGYPDWTHTYHHAGFDIVSNRILEIVSEYMDKETEDMFDDYCFWVTGHSMGGGVANIVGAELLHSWNGINSRTDNVYCYTFAAPNTFYLTDNKYERENRGIEGKKITVNYREPHGVKYRCIFNIVNEDDFVPKLPMEECEWTKYGRVAGLSVKNKYHLYENNLGIYLYYNYSDSMYYYANNNLGSFLGNYKGNPNVPMTIVEGFANIFNNNSNMRNETYANEETTNILIHKGTDVNNTIPLYTLPYQSLVKVDDSVKKQGEITYEMIVYEQSQKPAYLFQLVANSMHEYIINRYNNKKEKNPIGNKIKLTSTPLPMKYNNAKNRLLIDIDSISFNFALLEEPHYVESYYALTNMINTLDFE